MLWGYWCFSDWRVKTWEWGPFFLFITTWFSLWHIYLKLKPIQVLLVRNINIENSLHIYSKPYACWFEKQGKLLKILKKWITPKIKLTGFIYVVDFEEKNCLLYQKKVGCIWWGQIKQKFYNIQSYNLSVSFWLLLLLYHLHNNSKRTNDGFVNCKRYNLTDSLV